MTVVPFSDRISENNNGQIPPTSDSSNGEKLPGRSLHWHVIGGNNKNRIGMNSGMCVYEETNSLGQTETKRVLFDMGALMSDPKCPEDPLLSDFDTVLPDITRYLEKPGDTAHVPEALIDAVFLTHNHSDHIGAIPLLLLMGYKVPKIHATPYTAKRLEQELSSAGLDPKEWPEIFLIAPGMPVEIGPVKVSAFWVSHSTPQCVGYFIETPEANILAPGDFKLDQTVIWGPAFDGDKYRRLVEKGVDLMLMDSTGADRDVDPVTEEDVRESLRDLMEKYPDRRFVVAVMSGFEENMASVAKVSAEYGRDLWVSGWSHEQALRALKDTGLTLGDSIGMDIAVNVLTNGKPSRDLAETKSGAATVVVTGAQGMPGAALTRAVLGTHAGLTLDPEKDIILFCAPSIPGQEAYRERLLATLRNQGHTVLTRKDLPLYSQAHARLPEIIDMAKLTKAKTILPAHGDRNLRGRCAEAMQKIGQNVITAENGQIIRVTKTGCTPVSSPDVDTPKLLAFKTLEGATWTEKNYIMARLPQDRAYLEGKQAANNNGNNNNRPRPKIFGLGS
jgi:ribonuclease J